MLVSRANLGDLEDDGDVGGLVDDLKARGRAYTQAWIDRFNTLGQRFYALRQPIEQARAKLIAAYPGGATAPGIQPALAAIDTRLKELHAYQAETRKFRDWVYQFEDLALGNPLAIGALKVLVMGGVAVVGVNELSAAYQGLDAKRIDAESYSGRVKAAEKQVSEAKTPTERKRAEDQLNRLLDRPPETGSKVNWWLIALGISLALGLGLAWYYRAKVFRALKGMA